ncbi:MAG: DNA recombination protein RmuC [Flavobacteriaceae bacterium]|jgi:DNA recombination protein RmuC
MTQILLAITLVILVVNTLVIFFRKPKLDMSSNIDKTVGRIDTILQDQFQRNRSETSNELKDNRQELSQTLNLNSKNIQETVSSNLKDIKKDTNSQLDRIRNTVDEKLQKTLNSRLKQSFGAVAEQLESVQQGLGEMKNLATDVGGLKKVLSNVKRRGGLGEMQLEMLLENIFAPGQFSRNVITNPNTSDSVEFVVNLPGYDINREHVMLPIDAKYPMDIYEELLNAYDSADMDRVKKARKELRKTIKSMAKDISTKYIFPPRTTDFAYLYLPFEGIYAEVSRDADLIMELQNELKITVTGPSTLGAILHAFQMGFRTLAIEKRTSEVWETLVSVKKEFSKFSEIMGKAQKHIQTGLGKLDEVMGVRTRAIEKNLRSIEVNEIEANTRLIDNDKS